VNTAPILAAQIVFDDDGTPRSIEHGDIYHPRDGALAQAKHVFLEDGALAERWRGRDRFVILETGFGLGNNFLATLAAWRADPGRCRHLHFLSIEQSPPTRTTISGVPRDAALAPLAEELALRWPPLTCNLHRLSFDGGAVELLLAFGSAAAWLPQLIATVDAIFLDGFAPARNPSLWEPRLFRAIARLAAAGASVATWSAARAVRDGLASAGFAVERAVGAGEKRDITRGRFSPGFVPRTTLRRAHAVAPARHGVGDERRADVVIVGAGLAGCALADALAARGLRSLLLERHTDVAAEASGNPAAIFRGVVHRADGRHARFHRAAALAAADAVQGAIERHAIPGSTEGLLRLETELDIAAMREVVAAQALPPEYVAALDSEAASRLAGVRLRFAAWHYRRGGWVDPRALARAWLADAGERARVVFGVAAATILRKGADWCVGDEHGMPIATAAALVVCDGAGALLGERVWPVRRQRGQIGVIAAASLPRGALPRLPIAGHGHALPPIDGRVWFGSATSWDDDDGDLRWPEQQSNVDRLAALLGLDATPRLDRLAGRVGFRWSSEDRLPIVGAVPAEFVEGVAPRPAFARPTRRDQPRFIARAPGLFVFGALGSRGVASASLGAQMLAATIAGSPVPAEADLVDAVDPARFLSRRFRSAEAERERRADEDQPPVGSIAGSLGG
jgi:tRNA 5-methylaminomethyl-2-thiouridine biosynthesis bifunctional protein